MGFQETTRPNRPAGCNFQKRRLSSTGSGVTFRNAETLVRDNRNGSMKSIHAGDRRSVLRLTLLKQLRLWMDQQKGLLLLQVQSDGVLVIDDAIVGWRLEQPRAGLDTSDVD